MVKGVAGLAGENAPHDRLAQQAQVADQVQDLVPDALVGEAELVLDRPVLTEYQDVVIGQVRAQPAGQQLVSLRLQDEGPSRGDVPHE